MQLLVFDLVFMLMREIVLHADKELTTQPFDSAKRTRQVSRDHIGCGVDIVVVEDFAVTFEIGIKHR